MARLASIQRFTRGASLVLAVATLGIFAWSSVASVKSLGVLFERRSSSTRFVIYSCRGTVCLARYTTRWLDPEWACTAVDTYTFGPYGLPLWVPALLSAALFGVATAAGALRQHRATGLCAHCGYNLTGNTSGVCPECGIVL